MAGLLSAQEEQEIRDAVKSVTDTFMRTSVTYKMYGDSLDRFQEDRKRTQTKDEYILPCLVEYKEADDAERIEGATQQNKVKLTVNMDDLEALHLVSAPKWTVPFNSTKDYFICQGKQYKVDYIGYDGALNTKQCLCIIVGVLDKTHS